MNLIHIFQLVLAMILGALLGLEREYLGKVAGTRTYGLVSLGAALLTILSLEAFSRFEGLANVSYDPSRIAGQIIVGIGFLGAGLIIHHGLKVKGLTTAAGLWVCAAIGMAVGCRFYGLAILTTFLAFFLLYILRRFDIERRLTKRFAQEDEE